MRSRAQAPSLPLLAYGFLLTGLGTALLGPILPLLAARHHLSDASIGLLPLAQFLGATVGGMTVFRRPQYSFGTGAFAAAAGLALFAIAPALPMLMAVLFGGAWGIGQMIASSNVITGSRYTQNRASALTLLNALFSAGALLSPLFASWLTPHMRLRSMLLGFAALFAIAALLFAFERSRTPIDVPENTSAAASDVPPVGLHLFLFFALLLALYGAYESSFNVWLTTYMLRYGGRSLSESQAVTSVFWIALACARPLSSAVLLRLKDTLLQRLALVALVISTLALLFAHTAVEITVVAVILGLSLGPVFPVTFALILGRKPSPRQAGVILAASGLGAALLPWLMGVLSRQSDSLRTAFLLPLAVAVGLLIFSFRLSRSAQ
ncbi:MFS transporter [Terriglobus albidus]|uniref:MFS transporter n=1 Tax=Terriglobus albidus TaxID=1592106 RepID=A0A5B9EHH3_9BACT|nr:MFS transporter [Terriglobus albidus]QEE29516.1 MFS transporter [Terriglobus albidus]